jgi:hypothetical protein
MGGERMAKSLLLHTYSKYAKKNIDTEFISYLNNSNSLENDIDKMEGKERELYNKYNADTFE